MSVIGILCGNDGLSYIVIEGTPASPKVINCESCDLKRHVKKGALLDAAKYRIEAEIKRHKVSKAALLVSDTALRGGSTHPVNRAININPIKRYQTAHEMLKEIERTALCKYDWIKDDNQWHSTVNHTDFQIETEKNGRLFDVITSKKSVGANQFIIIKQHCYDRIDFTNVDGIIGKIISKIDERFET